MFSYDDGTTAAALAERARTFLDETVIPAERDALREGPIGDERLAELREAAREAGVYAPQVPEAYGGQGLTLRESLPAFEALGRSLLGPAAARIGAPDEGNIHTLERLGTEAQRERWLEPLVAGEISSGFSMTEPLDGAGSDPKQIQTTARKAGDEWVIDGHKWWTTGGGSAELLIVMARTDPDAHPYEGCSLFLVPADTPGVEIVRDIPHMGGTVTGQTHAEIRYDEVRVPDANLLGRENAGFTHAQQRLGPARLTHCMRFAGLAERALDIAVAYASQRAAFGERVADKQGPRFDVAEAHTELHAVRTMVRDAADRLAAGEEARLPVAATKLFAANAVQSAVDTALQLCGANGVGRDLPIADFFQAARQFRIIDGADEVHKRSIAREAFADPDTSELVGLTRYGE